MTRETRSSETRIDRSGRVVIPAWVRRRLDLHPDTELRVSIRDGTLCLEPRAVTYRRARDRLKRYFTEDRDDVTELWNERRDEAGPDD
jgi:AbrB family looped-hinge helix DNA binding protein